MAASASSELLQHSDLEETEASEIDEAFLKELLEDPEKKEGSEQQDMTNQIVHPLDINSNSNAEDINLKFDTSKRAEEIKVGTFDYPEWPDIVPNSPLVYETMEWYLEQIMNGRGEFNCNIDYSMLDNEFFFEDTTYGCLWQD